MHKSEILHNRVAELPPVHTLAHACTHALCSFYLLVEVVQKNTEEERALLC